jgi:hypothetical protein
MSGIDRIRQEYETVLDKKREFSERLKQLEKTEPNNFYQIWIIRDQIAYLEGKSEGLKFAIEEFDQ